MKKTTLTFLFSTFLFSLLSIASSFNDSEVRNLSDFDRVSVATGIQLHLVKGNEHKAEIEVDGIELDDVVTKVSEGRLSIKVGKKNWFNWGKSKNRKVNVTLTYTELDGISASSGAYVSSDETIVSDALKCKASSGAKIKLEVEAERIASSASSGANIYLSGECNEHKAAVSSGAGIASQDLEANHVKASASSGAEVKVWANESLDASASSGGRIKYEGSPSDINRSKSSGGSIRKI